MYLIINSEDAMPENSAPFVLQMCLRCMITCILPSMLTAQLMFSISVPPTVTSAAFSSARKDGEILALGGKSGSTENSADHCPHNDNLYIYPDVVC